MNLVPCDACGSRRDVSDETLLCPACAAEHYVGTCVACGGRMVRLRSRGPLPSPCERCQARPVLARIPREQIDAALQHAFDARIGTDPTPRFAAALGLSDVVAQGVLDLVLEERAGVPVPRKAWGRPPD